MIKTGSHIGKKDGKPMDKFESSYKKFAKYEPYKVACSECKILFYKADDDPFVCLECSVR